MTTKAEWLALAERCEKATGPDREIDYRMAYGLGWRFDGYHLARDLPCLSDEQFANLHNLAGQWKRPGVVDWPYPGTNHAEPCVWTASLDAITALIERELPGWRWKTGRAEFHCWATIYGGSGEGSVFSAVSIQGSAAIALCAAFCRAMAEKAA
jgi:hypothetical protein